MIHLEYCNGDTWIFNVDDWITLRKTHRILGVFVGSDNVVESLPLKLLPEEALLLFDKGIAKTINREVNITPEIKSQYEQYENELLAEQKVIYKNKRKKQLESILDKIVAAKRKKGDNRAADDILNEELEKSCQITKENMLWPILLAPMFFSENSSEVSKHTILQQTSELKYIIFKDLWEKGYYITAGHKFGGDFLVYLGDPIAYHAIFIVHCVEHPTQLINSTEVVAFGRLATSVKKRAVLASVSADNFVSYITINWIDA